MIYFVLLLFQRWGASGPEVQQKCGPPTSGAKGRIKRLSNLCRNLEPARQLVECPSATPPSCVERPSTSSVPSSHRRRSTRLMNSSRPMLPPSPTAPRHSLETAISDPASCGPLSLLRLPPRLLLPVPPRVYLRRERATDTHAHTRTSANRPQARRHRHHTPKHENEGGKKEGKQKPKDDATQAKGERGGKG